MTGALDWVTRTVDPERPRAPVELFLHIQADTWADIEGEFDYIARRLADHRIHNYVSGAAILETVDTADPDGTWRDRRRVWVNRLPAEEAQP